MNLHRILSFAFSFLNMVLLMVAHSFPNWTAYTAEIDGFQIGLWIVCSQKYGCKMVQDADVNMNFVRYFMLSALFISIVPVLLTISLESNVCQKMIFSQKALLTAAFNFLAGMFVLIAVLVCEFQINKKIGMIHPSKIWAFHLSCAITILLFLSGIYTYVIYWFSLWENNADKQDADKTTINE